jgi:hypothetical protein
LKDKAFSTLLNQKPPFEPRPEKGIFGSAEAYSAGGPSSTTTPSATSERQIAVAPLSLIALQSIRGMPFKKFQSNRKTHATGSSERAKAPTRDLGALRQIAGKIEGSSSPMRRPCSVANRSRKTTTDQQQMIPPLPYRKREHISGEHGCRRPEGSHRILIKIE